MESVGLLRVIIDMELIMGVKNESTSNCQSCRYLSNRIIYFRIQEFVRRRVHDTLRQFGYNHNEDIQSIPDFCHFSKITDCTLYDEQR